MYVESQVIMLLNADIEREMEILPGLKLIWLKLKEMMT
jgi:hypothetical protein